MKLVIEILSDEVLPTLRAIVGKKLVEVYGLSQKNAAERLGLTQPAISQYKRDLRGYRTALFTENPAVLSALDAAAKKFATGSVQLSDVAEEFSDICRLIVSEGIAHRIHQETGAEVGDCEFCYGSKEKKK
jgi:predicted transcriptional regulator